MRVVFSFIVFAAILLNSAGASAKERQVALTFDDAPRGDGILLSGAERTQRLIEALAAAEVAGAMFFANSDKVIKSEPEGRKRLAQYAAAGHTIANHSHSHPSANSLAPEAFLKDVDHAQEVLGKLPGYVRFFRFPFLHEGRPRQRRDAIRAGLTELGLQQGYVTVDNYDWYLQALLSESIKSGTKFDEAAWRQMYVAVLTEAIEFYDTIARRALGRSPGHVMLLHENDLAALFVDDLVTALRESGWQIIPATQAYEDPIASTHPDTLFLNQGRVAALAADAGWEPRDLIHAMENEAALRARLVRAGMMEPLEGAYLKQEPPGKTPQKFAPGIVSLDAQHEYGITFSSDGLEMYFGVELGHRAEIRGMRFEAGQWTRPTVVARDDTHTFGDPYLTLDGSRLYFISNQPNAVSADPDAFDIGYLQRGRDGWSEPQFLQAPVNTPSNEYYTSWSFDGTLAFASDRNAEREGDMDLYLGRKTEATPGTVPQTEIIRLPGSINTKAYEADPFLAHDGSFLIFGSTRRSGLGYGDLYIAYRGEDEVWGKAVSLGEPFNTTGHELCPFVTHDGRYFFYTSNKDIYWVDAGVLEPFRAASLGGEDSR